MNFVLVYCHLSSPKTLLTSPHFSLFLPPIPHLSSFLYFFSPPTSHTRPLFFPPHVTLPLAAPTCINGRVKVEKGKRKKKNLPKPWASSLGKRQMLTRQTSGGGVGVKGGGEEKRAGGEENTVEWVEMMHVVWWKSRETEGRGKKKNKDGEKSLRQQRDWNEIYVS